MVVLRRVGVRGCGVKVGLCWGFVREDCLHPAPVHDHLLPSVLYLALVQSVVITCEACCCEEASQHLLRHAYATVSRPGMAMQVASVLPSGSQTSC